jgi:hypothetical protein
VLVSAYNGTAAASGGGGKLVLKGSTGSLGTAGVIQADGAKTLAELTATGPTDNSADEYTFPGVASASGIPSGTTAAGFTSIEAGTGNDTGDTEANRIAGNGTVTFKAGASSTSLINKALTVKSTSA